MGRKKERNPRTKHIGFRVTFKEYEKARWLAKTYAKGKMSKWARHGLLNAEREFLK